MRGEGAVRLPGRLWPVRASRIILVLVACAMYLVVRPMAECGDQVTASASASRGERIPGGACHLPGSLAHEARGAAAAGAAAAHGRGAP